jgi:hypothetical protein
LDEAMKSAVNFVKISFILPSVSGSMAPLATIVSRMPPV